MYSPIKKLSKVFTLNPTVTATLYTAGWIVGGLQQLTDFFDSLSGVTEIINVAANDNANQKAQLIFCFFGKKPAGAFTDGTAFNPSQADLNLIQAMVILPAANYQSATANAFGVIGNVRQKVKAAVATNQLFSSSAGKNAWLVVFTSGTPTYGATTALQLQIAVEQDV
jgi:hypothetical protein